MTGTAVDTSLRDEIRARGREARAASRVLALTTTEDKNRALLRMAEVLAEHAPRILAANALDVEAAEAAGLSEAMVDRLRLDDERLAGVVAAVRQVAELDDPVGATLREWSAAQDLALQKVRVPIGVVGIVYESRPNVTVDAATLCFKSGNAVLLRGGSEAFHSNHAFASALTEALEAEGLPAGCIHVLASTDREGVRHLAEMDEFLDLLIPRGGHQLIEAVVSAARVPVLKHYHGVCHVYVDRAADLEMAARISENAKVQRPGVCNAMETLLVHRDVAAAFLPAHVEHLRELGVEIRGDETTCALTGCARASDGDWAEEYLALVLSVRVVDSLDQAVEHIARFGSNHTDAIVTEDSDRAERFLVAIDSSTVLWNASTRFADGGEFGFGAEIGISTDKLHARGPMALEGADDLQVPGEGHRPSTVGRRARADGYQPCARPVSMLRPLRGLRAPCSLKLASLGGLGAGRVISRAAAGASTRGSSSPLASDYHGEHQATPAPASLCRCSVPSGDQPCARHARSKTRSPLGVLGRGSASSRSGLEPRRRGSTAVVGHHGEHPPRLRPPCVDAPSPPGTPRSKRASPASLGEG